MFRSATDNLLNISDFKNAGTLPNYKENEITFGCDLIRLINNKPLASERSAAGSEFRRPAKTPIQYLTRQINSLSNTLNIIFGEVRAGCICVSNLPLALKNNAIILRYAIAILSMWQVTKPLYKQEK